MDCLRQLVDPLRLLRRKRRGMRDPAFAFYWQALRNWRAHWQHAAEFHVVPVRRKMNPAVAITVAIDHAAQCGKWQIKAIERMCEQQGIARRRFDAPQVVKLDHESIGLEQWRADNLAYVVE